MSIKTISVVSGAALLALTATASAGPTSVASSGIIAPPTSIEQARHYRHYGWHYGWHRHRHYGYGYGYPRYYHYGYAGAAAPVVAGEAASGNYCATAVKTCLLYEPGWLGTGCSCKVPGGRARGTVQ